MNLGEAANALHYFEQEGQERQRHLARYLLLFMVKGITTELCFPLSYYATDGITADLLYPLLWEAIRTLELVTDLRVLFITCDGASPNRKFFNIHGEGELVNFTRNPYNRALNIYFISDVPHLLKTARNCLSNSYSHRNTRSLWRGNTISWMYFVNLYRDFCSGLYSLCPKLKQDHIQLTSFSVMNVKLAAQVLSSTVANALELKYGPHVHETVQFIRLMDKWFDIMNVKNLNECILKRKPDLAPFRQVDDPRLGWLLGDFLDYFREWKNLVNARDVSKSEQAAMMLSYQTMQGLEISVKSIVSCIKIVLNEGADFVLTRTFNQDKVEQFFGLLRMRGGANDNPNVRMAGNLVNHLRFIRTNQFEDIRGNVHAQIHRQVDQNPLPRRRR